jgi:hypothetical protein
MSGPPENDRPPDAPAEDSASVLARLPRTRPQRSSPRRAAARARSRRTESAAPQGLAPESTPPESTPPAAPPLRASPNGHAPASETPTGANGRAQAGSGGKKVIAGVAKRPAARARNTDAGKGAGQRARKAARKPAGASPTPPPPPAPRQGYECEGENASRTVHPPAGAELVASIAEVVGELAKGGVSAGERLLRDALSRLPRP